jgi:hypothetical protein
MPRVVALASVENSAEWEQRFRTHVDVFKAYTATAVDFATTSDNEIAICFEVENLDTYLQQMKSPEPEAAMAHDGVKRETVKLFVLDKRVDL